MPPSSTPPRPPIIDPNHMLPAHPKKSGPVVGIVIIVLLLVFGGLYFWGAYLNAKDAEVEQLPLIQGEGAQ